jgi:hypothetical protein
MPVDVDDVFRQGGVVLIDFLQFCVLSAQPEPVFALLVREYRGGPTAARALALYDLFCAPGAPARIKADTALPPHDPRLPRAIEVIRRPAALPPEGAPADDEAPPPPPRPAVYLFDAVLTHLAQGPDSVVQTVGRQFDPGRTPLENLPGGRMTAGQKAFVQNVWRPRVRPALVAAGFWRVGTIGG